MDFGQRLTEPEECGSHLIRRRFHGEDAFFLVNAAFANNLLSQRGACAVMEGIDVMLVADMHQRIEERGWTQAELAERLGYSAKHVNRLVQGKVALTEDAALRLEPVLGASAGFWLTREARYPAPRLAGGLELLDLQAGFIVMSVPSTAFRIAPTSSNRPICDNFTPAVAKRSASPSARTSHWPPCCCSATGPRWPGTRRNTS